MSRSSGNGSSEKMLSLDYSIAWLALLLNGLSFFSALPTGTTAISCYNPDSVSKNAGSSGYVVNRTSLDGVLSVLFSMITRSSILGMLTLTIFPSFGFIIA